MTDEERLEQLLDRWEQSQQPGSRPSPEEVCRDCPHLLESFRRRLRVLDRVDGFLQGKQALLSPVVPSTRNGGTGTDDVPEDKAPAGEQILPTVPGFEVLAKLGEGGMGVVYKARQEGLNRLVALKMVRRDVASAQALARFRGEAEAVARLQHPHVVAVHAWGEQEGVPFLALEFCPGGSLHGKIRGRPQPSVEAARLVEKLARAVQAAHERGIVHRDLKPANVLLAPAGDEPALNTLWGIPKVADFGLCRCFEADRQRTAEGAVMGSPPYMAPEQAEGRTREVGPATDVWALGAILYEVLTGRPPFGGPSLPAVLHAVRYEEPPRPGALNPGVPAGLEAICLKCLRKSAKERYARAADLAADLRAWLAGQSPEAISTAPGESPGTSLSPGPSLPETLPWGKKRGPRRAWLVAAGLLLAALLGLGAWAWWDRTPPDSSTPAVLPPPKDKPLSVHLQVFRTEQEGFNRRQIGELGRSTFRVRLNEGVEVEATLSEPAYAYLIAFNPATRPDDQEQHVRRDEGTRPPEKRRAIDRRALELDDGEGLQAFAVVASRQPLPAYEVWRKTRPPLGWQRTPALSGVVWRADGDSVDGTYEDGVDRAREARSPAKTVIRELARRLKETPGIEAVEVVGFAVDRLQ